MNLVLTFNFSISLLQDFSTLWVTWITYYLHLQIDYLLTTVKLITTGVFLTPECY